ncbi:MAG TPA: secondary thiamine-phosphate synthase enzyme YjbQ [Myxococcales bacterium]|nr:secondary thiamine-phosphate synthase enzyme YjbQ [Myxococcales bacterium]
MKVHQEEIEVSPRGRGLHDVTEQVGRAVARAGVRTGLCTVFVQHTSASLVVQENADAAVLRDLERWAERIAPEDADYEHDAEGPDDMPSHIRAAFTRTAETIPIRDGSILLGTWQAIYLWEHRRSPHRRHLVVTVIGA